MSRRCNFRATPQTPGDKSYTPTRFPAIEETDSEPESSALNLPREDLQEVCNNIYISAVLLMCILHVVAFLIGVCGLNLLTICLLTQGAFSSRKFINFSQALFNSTSSCNQIKIPTNHPCRYHRRQRCQTCSPGIVSIAVDTSFLYAGSIT